MLSGLTEKHIQAIQGELCTTVSPFSALFNYENAVRKHFTSMLNCYKLVVDVEDGVVIEAEENRELTAAAAYAIAIKNAKAILGCYEEVISMDDTYIVDELKIENCRLMTDVRLAKRIARRLINDLTHTWDFRSYEIGVFAMVLIEMAEKDQSLNGSCLEKEEVA